MDIDNDIVTAEFDDVEFEDLLDTLTKEAELRNYRIIKILNIDNIKERKGLVKELKVAFQKYKIIEFCNLFTCNDVITADLRAGVFVPQRFAVYQPLNEKTIYVSFLKPSAYARLFNSKEMIKTAQQLTKDMEDVIEAAES